MSSRRLGLAVVVGASPVKTVLELTGMDKLFPLVTTQKEALKALGLV